MNNTGLKTKVSQKFNRFGLKVKKHSPEILVVTGVVGVVTAAVLACRATTKASKIIQEAKEQVETINYCAENPEKLPEPYTKEDAKKDTNIVNVQTGLVIAKTYAPAVILGGVSIAAILGGHKILRKRNLALGAAYAAVDTGFKEYRKRVVDRFGQEIEKELRYNIQTKQVEETVVDENGKEKVVKKNIQTIDPTNQTPYTFCFDVGCPDWQKDAEHNKWFLIQQQNWANEKLKAQGHLFLNDVLDMLGLPKTKSGQIVGWLLNNPKGDGYVDFGLLDINSQANKDFMNGYERSVWLTFNVDGPIYDLI